MIAPRRLQLRRGNTAATSTYVGAPGELVVNTTTNTLYLHDGSTVGGYATTINVATITNQIASAEANIILANIGMQGYVNLANTIQSAQLTSANLGIIGYVNLANTIQSAQLTSANLGIIGYIDQANTIQSAQVGAANLAIIAANLGMKGYVDSVASQSIYGNGNVKSYLTQFDGNIIPSANSVYSLGSVTNQWKSLFVSNSTIYVGGVPLSIDATGNLTVNGNIIPTIGYVNAQVANVTVDLSAYALNANVTAANVGLKGYVDQANTIQSSQLTSANLGIIGYIDQANTIQSAQVGAANLAITAANVGLKGYVDSQSFYSNAKVATYLPTYSGNISANISKAGYTWTFGADGTTSFPNSLILAPAGTSITMQSDQYSQLMWENANLTVAPNMAINSNFYVAQNNATLDIGYRDGSSTQLIKSWYWNVDGNLKLPSGGYILNSDDSIYGGGDYSNVQVATYLPTYTGVVTASNVAVAGNVTANYFVGNGSQLTGLNTVYFLEAYASVTYTLPGSFTEDPCRYSVVSSNVNVSSSWFNTSTYTFTPQKAGYWEITAAYDVYRNAEASLAIKKNNSIVAAAGSFNAVAQQITKIIYLNGSTDSANVVNVGGAALSRSQYDSRSWFQARWIGA